MSAQIRKKYGTIDSPCRQPLSAALLIINYSVLNHTSLECILEVLNPIFKIRSKMKEVQFSGYTGQSTKESVMSLFKQNNIKMTDIKLCSVKGKNKLYYLQYIFPLILFI